MDLTDIQCIKPPAGFDQRLILFREGEPEFRLSPFMVKRASRNRRHPGLFYEIAGKLCIGHTEPGNIREDMVCSFGQLAGEPCILQPIKENVPFPVLFPGKFMVIGFRQMECCNTGMLQRGGCTHG